MTSPIDIAKFQHLKATGDLPSPKGPAMAIVRLTQQENTSLADLVHAVKTDPALVGRLIKAANSVQVGAHRPVASIQDALTLLGIPAVRALALSFSLLSGYRQGKCASFDYRRFWSHSLACGVALQALAQRTRAAPPEDCFSIGLLAAVGELALATLFPDEYARVLDQAKAERNRSLAELEEEAFAMTHGELTTAMLLDWGLPKVFADSVFHHERPDQADFAEGSRQQAILWSLVLAGRIADVCLAADADRRALVPGLFMLGGKLSIGTDALVPLCNRVVQEWQEWGAMLDVEVGAVPPFEEMSQALTPPANGRATPGDERYRMRILVVDGDGEVRATLKSLLAEAGHEIYEADDGQRGFEMALELRPQIAIVDWLAPRMSGIEMTRALRQTKIGRSIYVLTLTDVEEDDRLIEALESGVDDFVAKPLKPRLLAARLRSGQRVVKLQEEVERDREDIRRFAAELAVTNRRLQEAALTDTLTGFPNRRYAMERIEQEWASSGRSKRPLACMIIDVDKFKQINDSHGHDAGDSALKQAAAALKRGLRAQDAVARIGGDEFLVICPDTTLDAALACAERVRRSVDSMQIATDSGTLRNSVSIGVAVREEGMRAADDLIKRADQGVYLAKQRGRNCVGTVQTAKA